MPVPQPVRLFHITAVTNLPAICAAGALQPKNLTAKRGGTYKNIAYQGAQGKRASKALPNPPGGVMHDYVPFYFAPRSPMLSAIHSGKVPHCPGGQGDIVHLETTIDKALANGQPYVFFDRNATLDYSEPYTDVASLHEIAWDLLTESPQLDGYCKYFQNRANGRYADRTERRMAEFLVQGLVPLSSIVRIGVISLETQAQVAAILATAGVRLAVDVMTDWYFLGQ